MIKVLFISRPTLFSSPGGDTIQMENTRFYLEKNFDIEVTIDNGESPINYHNFDLIHFFNIIRPNNILAHIKSDIPYVVSPIYVDYSEYDQKVRGGVFGKVASILGKGKSEYLKSMARWIRNGEHPGSDYFIWRGYTNSIEKILKKCRVVLPNSESELLRLRSDFSFSCPAVIVPNSVDISKFNSIRKEKKGVICVARIEGRKNQLNLIKAIKLTDLKLFIIGKASPNHSHYYETCKREANDQISFVDHISQEELISYYEKSKVHAMVSWFETTGLSSLEAAACGCNIVISEKGDQKEYFGEEVDYADPASINSIKEAIENAYLAEPSQKLINRISSNYTWQNTAELTMKAYKKALILNE